MAEKTEMEEKSGEEEMETQQEEEEKSGDSDEDDSSGDEGQNGQRISELQSQVSWWNKDKLPIKLSTTENRQTVTSQDNPMELHGHGHALSYNIGKMYNKQRVIKLNESTSTMCICLDYLDCSTSEAQWEPHMRAHEFEFLFVCVLFFLV